jgi:hypothetical protein
VTDVSARVENILGFIEPYRDPVGIPSEWEAMIGGIADADEILKMKKVRQKLKHLHSTTPIGARGWE